MNTNTNENQENKKNSSSSKIYWAFERYSFYTKEVSKIARQLAFSEGAIFWAIYLIMSPKPKMLIVVFYSSLLLFFIFDHVQYLFGAHHFEAQAQMMKKIKKLNSDSQIKYEIDDEIGKNIKKFYILKLVFLAVSSLLLLVIFTIFVVT